MLIWGTLGLTICLSAANYNCQHCNIVTIFPRQYHGSTLKSASVILFTGVSYSFLSCISKNKIVHDNKCCFKSIAYKCLTQSNRPACWHFLVTFTRKGYMCSQSDPQTREEMEHQSTRTQKICTFTDATLVFVLTLSFLLFNCRGKTVGRTFCSLTWIYIYFKWEGYADVLWQGCPLKWHINNKETVKGQWFFVKLSV